MKQLRPSGFTFAFFAWMTWPSAWASLFKGLTKWAGKAFSPSYGWAAKCAWKNTS